MDSIFHERQQGQLCAQHCLNNLLQGPYFTAVELAGIARELDDAEQDRMAEGGVASRDYLKFMQQPSSNMDDSGYFSVQVISKALRVWNLDLTPFSSPTMKHAVEDPTVQTAYICNHDYHWLTVRKLGKQWFNLDSLQRKPKLVSDTYLSLFLTQLQMEGYSIFVVVGCLPTCEADELLTLVPVEPEKEGPSRHPQSSSGERKHSRGSKQPRRDYQQGAFATATSQESKQPRRDYKQEGEFAVQLAAALSESSKESSQYRRDFNQEEEDLAVQLVTAMSESYSLALKKEEEEVKLVSDSGGGGTLSDEEGDAVVIESSSEDSDAETTDAALAAAISASLDDQKDRSDGVSHEPVLSESELRERRLLHFGKDP